MKVKGLGNALKKSPAIAVMLAWELGRTYECLCNQLNLHNFIDVNVSDWSHAASCGAQFDFANITGDRLLQSCKTRDKKKIKALNDIADNYNLLLSAIREE